MANTWVARTMQDLEQATYGYTEYDAVLKADAPVLSTTTGVNNAVFGAFAWLQFNREASSFGALPKYVWSKSGIRVTTTRAAASGGGISETAAIPDSIKPTWANVTPLLKSMAHVFEVSDWQQFLVTESLDDNYGSLAQLRSDASEHHKEMINVALNTNFDTLASNNFESLDRMVCSTTERTNGGETAGDEDPWTSSVLDRSANSWSDAVISENSGTDRALTKLLIRTLIDNTSEAGANSTYWQTGTDTYSSIIGLFESVTRYNPLGQSKATFDVNGIQTAEGLNFGEKVSTLYDLPVIVSKDNIKDTISRVYLLDTSDPSGYGESRLGFKVAKPTVYYEAGTSQGNPFSIDKFASQGAFLTTGELICNMFNVQGKIRDLL